MACLYGVALGAVLFLLVILLPFELAYYAVKRKAHERRYRAWIHN